MKLEISGNSTEIELTDEDIEWDSEDTTTMTIRRGDSAELTFSRKELFGLLYNLYENGTGCDASAGDMISFHESLRMTDDQFDVYCQHYIDTGTYPHPDDRAYQTSTGDEFEKWVES